MIVRRRVSTVSRLVAVAALLLAVGCTQSKAGSDVPSALPSPLIVGSPAGYTFEPQKTIDAKFAVKTSDSLISEGRLFTIRKGSTLQGSLQVTVFKKDVDGQDPKVQDGILKGLGAGGRGFQVVHYGLTKLYATNTGETVLYVWFPANLNVMQLFVLRSGFADAGKVVRQVVADQLGYASPAGTSRP